MILKPQVLKLSLFLFTSVFSNTELSAQVAPLESRIRVSLTENISRRQQIGDRVVKSKGKIEYTGVLKQHTGSSFSLLVPNVSQLISIPFAALEKVEMYKGKKKHIGKGILIGGLTGLATGIITMVNLEDLSAPLTGSTLIIPNLVFSALGMTLGGVIGGMIRTEKWQEIPLDQFSKFPSQRSRYVSLGFAIPLKRY